MDVVVLAAPQKAGTDVRGLFQIARKPHCRRHSTEYIVHETKVALPIRTKPRDDKENYY